MTKRHHIRAIGESDLSDTAPGQADDDVYDLVEEETTVWQEDAENEDAPAPASAQLARIAAAACWAAAAAWTGFFAWSHRDAILAGAAPDQWADWVAAWATPLVLLAALWLVARRNSTREAKRFGEIGRSLAEESARLETRIAIVNRELSLAREFLTTQSRELEFLGRQASERISAHAAELQSLIRDNGVEVERIAGVSTSALDNMTKLRDNLPVLANSARDVSNQIGGAGRTAQAQLSELVAGFERLNEFGSASERQVASLRARVDDALGAFSAQTEHLQSLADARFAAMRTESETFRGELDSREVEALAGVRARAEALRAELADAQAASAAHYETAIAALAERMQSLTSSAADASAQVREGEAAALTAWTGQVDALRERLRTAVEEIAAMDERALANAQAKIQALTEEARAVDARLADRNRAFDQELAQRRQRIADDEVASGEALAARLAKFDSAISERREDHRMQLAAIENESQALVERVAALGSTFAAIEAQGRSAEGTLSQGIATLAASLTETREALDGTDMAVAALTDSSVRLLELIQASAKHARQDLPEAMGVAESRLSDIEARSQAIRSVMEDAGTAGNALEQAILASDSKTRDIIAAFEAFHEKMSSTGTAHSLDIAGLRHDLAAFATESEGVANRVQSEVRQALETLLDSARGALDALEGEQGDRIARLASGIGERSAAAIAASLTGETEGAIARLEDSARRSAEASREAAIQLRDQLVKVNELASNLESRISHARERAEQQVDNDFSRRVALITESLNSNSIDIAKALSSEVTDTAWAGYLRGDRGIFTRRAVRLLDNTEARDIAELYDSDRDFRDHVSRYIHDFEAMLRTLLSTRDGHAVSVTLLSSDMGKLYVVLAQALERLRQ